MKSLKASVILSLILLLSLPTVSCYTPADDDWNIAAPEEHGMSTSLLETAADEVYNIGGRQGFVVIRGGDLIYEKYYYGNKDTKNIAYSVTKAFGATLIGIASDMGLLDIDDPVARWIDAPWFTINENATIRHLLGQTAESDPPGSVFKYDSAFVINTLSEIASKASGMRSRDFAENYLMKPLGISDYIWKTDESGNVLFGFGLIASCRDLARLGQLYLNGGMWNGRRILSQEFINEATQPAFPEANAGYGFFWWLNGDCGTWHTALGLSGEGKMIEGAPANFYNAQGFFGQLIYVIPDLNIVAVTMGTTLQPESIYTKRKFWDALEICLPTAP